jgi:hypothetical protein
MSCLNIHCSRFHQIKTGRTRSVRCGSIDSLDIIWLTVSCVPTNSSLLRGNTDNQVGRRRAEGRTSDVFRGLLDRKGGSTQLHPPRGKIVSVLGPLNNFIPVKFIQHFLVTRKGQDSLQILIFLLLVRCVKNSNADDNVEESRRSKLIIKYLLQRQIGSVFPKRWSANNSRKFQVIMAPVCFWTLLLFIPLTSLPANSWRSPLFKSDLSFLNV